MNAELTFWQEYGTFIIAVGVGLLISVALVFIGSRAAAAYERTMQKHAQLYRGFSETRKQRKRADYEDFLGDLSSKAERARSFQRSGLYGGAVFLSFHAARLWIGQGAVQGSMKWVITLGLIGAAVAVVGLIERNLTRARKERLRQTATLDAEETPAS